VSTPVSTLEGMPVSHHLPLGPGAEFDAVRAMLDVWGAQARGIGDDGALLDVPPGTRLVVSTDTSVEDVHFRRAWMTPEEIGYRAAMAALSDLAAMGAAPLGLLVAATVPTAWRGVLTDVARGMGAAAAATGSPIVGGDVTAGDRLALGITVLGATARPISRGGARAGDRLFVTGTLGGPRRALLAWESGGVPRPEDRARFVAPIARIAAGQWLAAHGATAMLDLSDGLAGDAAHLAEASGVCVRIDLDRLPRVEDVSGAEAARSGEEYELLVAGPATLAEAWPFAAAGLPLTEVGVVTAGTGVALLGDEAGTLRAGAHDHFQHDIP